MRTLPLWLLFGLFSCGPADADKVGKEICDNSEDDDGDDLHDCADPDCAGQCPEVCTDLTDNDGDGAVDCLDTDCDGSCPENCTDGRDNDGDGAIDCGDLDCFGSCPEDCTDGRDNDADALIDCMDPDCVLDTCPEFCTDGRDNDADDLIDCVDPDCDGQCPEDCADGRDNDGDLMIDCDDPNCDGACPEVCDDGRDNDADGLVDCLDYECESECDRDGDSYYNADYGGDDCDDDDPAVNPGRTEICNRKDDDCNDLTDTDDPDLDLTTLIKWFDDFDSDGYGLGEEEDGVWECWVAGKAPNNTDCIDTNPDINPGITEVCNSIDDDCNELVDDEDPGLDLSTTTRWFLDEDRDDFGAAGASWDSCEPPAEEGYVTNNEDCDDRDPTMGPETYWLVDSDGDGYGDPGSAVGGLACSPPEPDLVAEWIGEDCKPGDPDIHPGAEEICEDGIDQDCDTVDGHCPQPSCRAWLDLEPSSTSGVYPIRITEVAPVFEVYCDMDTDGGGWSLVGSTWIVPLNDEKSDWYAELTTLRPENAYTGVWDAFRFIIPDTSDMRFSCKRIRDSEAMDVDLSFYDVDWYRKITSGSDFSGCFGPEDVADHLGSPARRNNITGVGLPLGDRYEGGALYGEASCSDYGGFTVDFDDRGMEGNPSDGTDWGEADSDIKCALEDEGEAWFVWVRE